MNGSRLFLRWFLFCGLALSLLEVSVQGAAGYVKYKNETGKRLYIRFHCLVNGVPQDGYLDVYSNGAIYIAYPYGDQGTLGEFYCQKIDNIPCTEFLSGYFLFINVCTMFRCDMHNCITHIIELL